MDIAFWLDACKLLSVEYPVLPGGVFFRQIERLAERIHH